MGEGYYRGGEETRVVSAEFWLYLCMHVCVWVGWNRDKTWALTSGDGFRLSGGGLERIRTTVSVRQGGPVFIPPFFPPSIPLPLHLPLPATTCLQATTSVPREMSATEKKDRKGLTFHMAGSPRLKRPDNPRRLD